jgi:hypothetical protein
MQVNQVAEIWNPQEDEESEFFTVPHVFLPESGRFWQILADSGNSSGFREFRGNGILAVVPAKL